MPSTEPLVRRESNAFRTPSQCALIVAALPAGALQEARRDDQGALGRRPERVRFPSHQRLRRGHERPDSGRQGEGPWIPDVADPDHDELPHRQQAGGPPRQPLRHYILCSGRTRVNPHDVGKNHISTLQRPDICMLPLQASAVLLTPSRGVPNIRAPRTGPQPSAAETGL